ncbi:MAG: class I SAM-dependent methyltransferase [Nitrospinae bacterium]|nr:class I SAM-dependent methyltransferase [Nitrospinota bacterium]
MDKNCKDHWEGIYKTKIPTEVGWYQADPKQSLDLIAAAGIGRTQKIIDIGGGASLLVDKLMEKGFEDVTVLDISPAALNQAKSRLGKNAQKISWIEADITGFEPDRKFDLWHDRAVFHFLTDADDRKKYVKVMNLAVAPGGHLIIATFALDGPPKCSGLEVVRYSPESLAKEIGRNFELKDAVEELHVTPSGMPQKFIYCRFKRRKG